MKNKKAIYILVPLLIAIWGGIAYQVMTFSSTEIAPSSSLNIPILAIEPTIFDTFSIYANYRDPFLGKTIEEKKTVIPAKTKVVVPEVKANIPWPKVSYGGVIKNQKSSKQLYLVQVNGNDNIMKEGDVVEKIQLVKAWKDSIQLVYQKEKKVVLKQ